MPFRPKLRGRGMARWILRYLGALDSDFHFVLESSFGIQYQAPGRSLPSPVSLNLRIFHPFSSTSFFLQTPKQANKIQTTSPTITHIKNPIPLLHSNHVRTRAYLISSHLRYYRFAIYPLFLQEIQNIMSWRSRFPSFKRSSSSSSASSSSTSLSNNSKADSKLNRNMSSQMQTAAQIQNAAVQEPTISKGTPERETGFPEPLSPG